MDGETYASLIINAAEYVKTKDGSISASRMLEAVLFPGVRGGDRKALRRGEAPAVSAPYLMEAPNVILLDEPTND